MIRRLSAILLFLLILSQPLFAEASLEINPYKPNPSPLTLPTFLFENDKNTTLSLKDFQGRFVLLNIWATWCAPCIQEMPSLDSLSSHLDPKKINIVALNVNSNGLMAAQNFYHHHSLNHLDIFFDPTGQIPTLLQLPGLPITLLIDTHGHEMGRYEGTIDWSSPSILQSLNTLTSSSDL